MGLTRVAGLPHQAGSAEGTSLRLTEPISFWGGIDPASGLIIDRRHPEAGRSVSGRILLMPHGRGSTTGAGALAECIRVGTGPAGIILQTPDHVMTVGVLAAAELYSDRICPLVVAAHPDDYEKLADGLPTAIHPDGSITQRPVA